MSPPVHGKLAAENIFLSCPVYDGRSNEEALLMIVRFCLAVPPLPLRFQIYEVGDGLRQKSVCLKFDLHCIFMQDL